MKTSPPIYFLAGSDEGAVRKAAAQKAGELAPGADAFGLETIDGAVETVDAAVRGIEQTVQALLTLPFLGGSKLIWLKSASFLADGVVGRSESVLEAIEKLCRTLKDGLPKGVSFLLSAPQADKRRKAYQTLAKLGHTEIYDLPNLGFRNGDEEIARWTASRVRERDLQLTPDAVEALAARVGLDTLQMESELEKLETAFGRTRKITASEVRLLVPQTREGGIFDISEAIGHRDLSLALDSLRQLFSQGERGVTILLVAIVPTVRNLLLVKDLVFRHRLSAGYFADSLKRLPESALAHLPRKKDGTLSTYALGIAAGNAAHFSQNELELAFCHCAAANQKLLSGSLPDDVILTRLLVGFL